MVKVMFFFLLVAFVPVKTVTYHTVCDTPAVEVYYTSCDDNNQLSASMDPCFLTWKGSVNLSLTFIPRVNLDYVYAIIEIWQNALKVSDGRYDLCSGIAEEFNFCGALKGETITIYKRRSLSKLPYFKGTFIVKLRAFAGQKEEPILCLDITITNKE